MAKGARGSRGGGRASPKGASARGYRATTTAKARQPAKKATPPKGKPQGGIKSGVKAAGRAILGDVPIVGTVIRAGEAYMDSSGSPKIADKPMIVGKKKRKHGIISKRGRKTISKAMRYYKQLSKAMRGIEKMAGKAGVRKGKPHYFRRKWNARWK